MRDGDMNVPTIIAGWVYARGAYLSSAAAAHLDEESPRPLILSVFRVRSFRFQLPADLLTSWAFQMETLILGWFVMVHTGSVLLLTLFASLQFAGTLTSPLFGVLGDPAGRPPHAVRHARDVRGVRRPLHDP